MRYPKNGSIMTVWRLAVLTVPLPPARPCIIAESAASASGASEPTKTPIVKTISSAGDSLSVARISGRKTASERSV